MQTTRYRLSRDGGRSTEALVEAGGYGYAHSCVTSENFPVMATPPPLTTTLKLNPLYGIGRAVAMIHLLKSWDGHPP